MNANGRREESKVDDQQAAEQFSAAIKQLPSSKGSPVVQQNSPMQQDRRTLIQQPITSLLHSEYQILQKLVKSSQSQVYLINKKDQKNDTHVVKVFSKDQQNVFKLELEVMNSIMKADLSKFGFPIMKSSKVAEHQSEILFEQLGPNVDQEVIRRPMTFTKAEYYNITLQLLNRVEQLHDLGYVHGDIKLQNIVFGKKDPKKIYLLDFGLCSKYIDSEGNHVPHKKLNQFVGNFLFCSLNTCRAYNKSRRDDFESIFYVMLYLINDFKLPWSNLMFFSMNTPEQMTNQLNQRLQMHIIKQTVEILPTQFQKHLKNCYLSLFEDKPDYSGLRNELISTLNKIQSSQKTQNSKILYSSTESQQMPNHQRLVQSQEDTSKNSQKQLNYQKQKNDNSQHNSQNFFQRPSDVQAAKSNGYNPAQILNISALNSSNVSSNGVREGISPISNYNNKGSSGGSGNSSAVNLVMDSSQSSNDQSGGKGRQVSFKHYQQSRFVNKEEVEISDDNSFENRSADDERLPKQHKMEEKPLQYELQEECDLDESEVLEYKESLPENFPWLMCPHNNDIKSINKNQKFN